MDNSQETQNEQTERMDMLARQQKWGKAFTSTPSSNFIYSICNVFLAFILSRFWYMVYPESTVQETLLALILFYLITIGIDLDDVRKNQVTNVHILGNINNKIHKEFENFWVNFSTLLNIRDRVDEINNEIYGKDKRG